MKGGAANELVRSMTDIEQAIARLETVSADAKEIDWIDQDDVAALRTVLAELRRLSSEYRDLVAASFHEIASEDSDGWFCSNGRSTAVGLGDELVAMGRYDKKSGGTGRVQWYRPRAAASAKD